MDRPSPIEPEVVLEHLDEVRQLARALVHGEADVEDVVQETALVALTHPPREPGRPGAWIAGVTRNVARSLRRRTTRQKRREDAARRADVEAPTDVIAARIEAQRSVLKVARDLKEPYRTVVFLRYFQDLTPTEIAARLGLSLATVKTRLRRGLELLRHRMDKEHAGSRREWMVALLPLAPPWSGAAERRSAAAGRAMRRRAARIRRRQPRNRVMRWPRLLVCACRSG